MLRVALNAHLVSFSQTYRNAGVSRFTDVLLEGLMHDDHDQRYIAYIGQREAAAAASSLHESERIQLVPAVWPTDRTLHRTLWQQTLLTAEQPRLGADHSQ